MCQQRVVTVWQQTGDHVAVGSGDRAAAETGDHVAAETGDHVAAETGVAGYDVTTDREGVLLQLVKVLQQGLVMQLLSTVGILLPLKV